MRFTIDELKSKADEKYEPLEVDLPSGETARFENMVRLQAEQQSSVMEHLNAARKKSSEEEADADGEVDGEVDGEAFDLTKFVTSASEQVDFIQDWIRLMVTDSQADEIIKMFGRDMGLYLLLFNSWMGSEGPQGEASPSAD